MVGEARRKAPGPARQAPRVLVVERRVPSKRVVTPTPRAARAARAAGAATASGSLRLSATALCELSATSSTAGDLALDTDSDWI